ncbi:MAG: response regulator [Myxococcota bacterium]
MAIVEDSFLVARGLATLLERHGCEIVGLAGTPEAALELIDAAEFDVAVLDIMLGNRSCADVALRLREQGREIIFVSGYGDLGMLPSELRSLPRLSKPVEPALLVQAIREAVATTG